MFRLPLAGAALAALLLATPALAVETTVSGIEIPAPDNTVKLNVQVSGDVGPKTVVLSDRVGINCGGFDYQWTKGENRQCWLWVRRGRTVTLTARGMTGKVGVDWQIDWTGCEVLEGGACKVTPEAETRVAAVFRGKPL